MEIEKTIRELSFYFKITTGCGHTKTMLDGANQSDCLIIMPNTHMGLTLFGSSKQNKILSLNDLPRALDGRRKPLCFDNSTLIKIFDDVLLEIQSKNEIIQKLTEENNRLKGQS